MSDIEEETLLSEPSSEQSVLRKKGRVLLLSIVVLGLITIAIAVVVVGSEPFQTTPAVEMTVHEPTAPISSSNRLALSEWCLKQRSIDGYTMEDPSCWTFGSELLVMNQTSYKTEKFDLNPVELVANKRFLFTGCSISRKAMHAFRSVISGEKPIKWHKTHGSLSFNVGKNTSIHWQWAPLMSDVLKYLNKADLESYDHVVVLIGLHDVQDTMIHHFPANVESFAKKLMQKYRPRIKDLTFQTAAPIVEKKMRNPNMKNDNFITFNTKMAREINSYNANQLPHHTFSLLNGYWNFGVNDQNDGLHSATHAKYTGYRYAWQLFWARLNNSI